VGGEGYRCEEGRRVGKREEVRQGRRLGKRSGKGSRLEGWGGGGRGERVGGGGVTILGCKTMARFPSPRCLNIFTIFGHGWSQ
jgi:hypothetical protein